MTADSSLVLDRERSPASPEPDAGAAAGFTARSAVLAVGALIAVAVGVALLVGEASRTPSGDAAEPATERSAAPFVLPDLRGGPTPVELTATPTRPTVVNFFAAWCEPCERELPALREAAAANPEIAFVGVDHQDSRADAVELLDAFGITYPAGYDPRGEVAARYGIRGLPVTVFVDTDGRIVDFHQGELSAKELQERLRRLTLKKPPA